MEIYKHPRYYEIAFSFFDVKEQINAFELIISKFSKIKANRFLDVACGPSLQLRELAKRGFEAIGLDLSPQMLKYLCEKAKEEKLKIQTVKADLAHFRLGQKVDFAFVMMGSLEFDSNEEFLSHLDSVAYSLRVGGLYFIQNKAVDWTTNPDQSWNAEENGIEVEISYKIHLKDILSQTFAETMSLEINDNGRHIILEDEKDIKFIFPQEFKALIELNGKFEFLGWWAGTESTWFLNSPLEKAKPPSNINMVLLRRK